MREGKGVAVSERLTDRGVRVAAGTLAVGTVAFEQLTLKDNIHRINTTHRYFSIVSP
jgi:hypothetical protein